MKGSFLPLFPEAASTLAGRVDALYFFLVAVSVVFAVGIALALLVLGLRYRRRSDDEVPAPVHGSILLEITWTVIPLGLAMVMFAWGASVYFAASRPPADAEEIFAIGKQWMWKFQHPNGKSEINALHVPVGRAIRMTMASEDVIHSFFVPAFRVKQDVLPARYSTTWFEATKVGEYHLFCAEYCGTEHSRMVGTVHVMEPDDYQRWLAGASAGVVSPAEAGEKLFGDLGCDTCHTAESGARGPHLAALFGSKVTLRGGREVTADEAYVRESILNPGTRVVAGYDPVMPTFQGQVNEEQILHLIAYIRALQ